MPIKLTNFYMVSPFSGGAESPFSKFTNFKGHIFQNRAILICIFFIFYILILSYNSVQNFKAITLVNHEIILTEKKPIFEITQL